MSADWALGNSSVSGSNSSSPRAELKRASSGSPTFSPPDQKQTRGSTHCASAEEPMPPPSRGEIASILSQMQFPPAQWGGVQGGDLLRSPLPIIAPDAFRRTAKDDVVVATASSSLSTEGPRSPQPAITTAANDSATRFLDGNWRPLPQPPHSAGQLAAEAALLGGPQVARLAGGSTSLGQPAHEPGHLGSAEEKHMVDIEWQFRQQVAAQQLLQAQQALQLQMQQQQLQQLQSHLLPPGPAPMPLYPAPQPVHAQGQMQNFWQPPLGLPLGAGSAESVRTFSFCLRCLFWLFILILFFSSLCFFLRYFFKSHTRTRTHIQQYPAAAAGAASAASADAAAATTTITEPFATARAGADAALPSAAASACARANAKLWAAFTGPSVRGRQCRIGAYVLFVYDAHLVYSF
jgi:hypothetical protein